MAASSSSKSQSNRLQIDFSGKKALVTGAGRGIGRDLSLLLVELGAHVVAVSRTLDDLLQLKQDAADLVGDRGDEAVTCVECDVGDVKSIRSAFETVGDIDLLVNNAGVALLEPLLETDPDNFDKTMAVNVRSALVCTQLVAKQLIARGKPGAVVNVSSQASLIALKDHTSYCTSKAGLDHLTKCMALELGSHGIRVNAVNPTVVMTEMGRKAWSDPAKAEPMLAQLPLGRFAEPREISTAIAFLLSDSAAMITGTIIPVDGGRCVQ